MPNDGHIDAYGAVAGWSPFMIGATTYLYDAEPKVVLSSFGPKVTYQRTSISANIQSRLTAVSTILKIGIGTYSRIYRQRDPASLSGLPVMLCYGTRFSATPVQRM